MCANVHSERTEAGGARAARARRQKSPQWGVMQRAAACRVIRAVCRAIRSRGSKVRRLLCTEAEVDARWLPLLLAAPSAVPMWCPRRCLRYCRCRRCCRRRVRRQCRCRRCPHRAALPPLLPVPMLVAVMCPRRRSRRCRRLCRRRCCRRRSLCRRRCHCRRLCRQCWC